MIIKNVRIENFRNIDLARFSPHKKMNIIYGENAQGKTNILEAIWLFTGEKSFRKAKDNELLKFDKESYRIRVKFESNEREQEAVLQFREKEYKKFTLNGVELSSASELVGKFNAVIFSPDDISIISDGPSVRREFLDNAITQIYPAYEKMLKNYNKALTQRNNALKDYRYHREIEYVLDAFENSIVNLGFSIIKYRKRYVDLLNEFCPDIYKEITEQKENIKIEYCTTIGATIDDFKVKLKKSREEDMYTLKTSIGPHRDNLQIDINGNSSRNYGSQGQKRTASLSIKLAEGEVINKTTGIRPIVLLDDVMSELDKTRQNYILNHIKNWQVFITCCDPNNINGLKSGRIFKVKNGRCVRE